MRKRKKKICLLFLSGLCCLTILSGCASGGKSPSAENKGAQDTEVDPSTVGNSKYKPSDLALPSQKKYEFPHMGLNFTLPQSLNERIDKQEVAMLNAEDINDDGTALRYALMKWKIMTEEQRNMEVESGGNGFYDWADSLSSIGAVGAYQSDAVEKLDELTGCTEHKEIGKSEDGSYTYYLSVNKEADSAMQEEINNISYEITEMQPLLEDTKETETESVGEFTMQDIGGESYTQEMFADYELTMVNAFTTWCTPCVNEIPDLQKLREEMSDKGVNVVGIVLDSVDGSGNTDEEAVEKAKTLAERTGAEYPFLIPDKGNLNGRLVGIEAVPETFFVDKEGNIVGETYSGSHSLEDWKSIVENELKGVAK